MDPAAPSLVGPAAPSLVGPASAGRRGGPKKRRREISRAAELGRGRPRTAIEAAE
jgi:hypothetical protein